MRRDHTFSQQNGSDSNNLAAANEENMRGIQNMLGNPVRVHFLVLTS